MSEVCGLLECGAEDGEVGNVSKILCLVEGDYGIRRLKI
jgi:hypothetical protein